MGGNSWVDTIRGHERYGDAGMNRVIKFRGFYKATKKMYEVIRIEFLNNMISLKESGSDLYYLGEPHQVELSQFTGLIDKNGKEIYEGDIWKDQRGHIDVVEWDTDIDTDRGWEICHGYLFMLSPEDDERTIEVIGNVWENPELVNQ